MSFKNKIVIITGASSGIGAVTAEYFGRLAAKVVLVARSEDKLKDVAKAVEKTNGIKPLIVKADVTKDDDVKKIVDETIKQFGQIDVLINNAGAGESAKIQDGIGPFDRMIALNLRGVYLLTHLAAPYLIKTKGNIINISSVAAVRPNNNFIPYCVAKAGLDMFTKCVAKDLASHGVRVNSVNPGPVETGFQRALGLSEQQIDGFLKVFKERSPLGYISTSDDVAELITFLSSEKARSITGSIYFIENGDLLSS